MCIIFTKLSVTARRTSSLFRDNSSILPLVHGIHPTKRLPTSRRTRSFSFHMHRAKTNTRQSWAEVSNRTIDQTQLPAEGVEVPNELRDISGRASRWDRASAPEQSPATNVLYSRNGRSLGNLNDHHRATGDNNLGERYPRYRTRRGNNRYFTWR